MNEEVEILTNGQDINEKIDQLEVALLANFETIDCPVKHYFVPGMYIREIFMPAGAKVTSLIHKTKHPFAVMKGKVSVFSENDGVQLIEAPYNGITTPNTRRVLHVHHDCVWLTYHPTSIQPTGDSKEEIEEAVRKVGEQIIDWRENPLLGGVVKNNQLMEKQTEKCLTD